MMPCVWARRLSGPHISVGRGERLSDERRSRRLEAGAGAGGSSSHHHYSISSSSVRPSSELEELWRLLLLETNST